MFVGSDEIAFKIRGVISTQCPALDLVLGRGGFPLGRLTIVYGKEGSGKTTLVLHALAECQAMGGVAVLIDKEYALDPPYAAAVGVNIERLIISQDGSLEDAFRLMNSVIDRVVEFRQRTGRRVPAMIALDSINACLGQATINADEDDAVIGVESRIWSRNLPKLLKRAYHEDIALVFISQVRTKINVMFGDPNDIAGGNAPKFYASILLQVQPTGASRETAGGEKTTGEDKDAIKVGYMAFAEAKKNRIAPPFRKANFLLRYGKGVDFNYSLLAVAVDHGIIDKNGAWYVYNGERIGQGAIAAAKYLDARPDVSAAINFQFRAKMGWDYSDLDALEVPTIEHSAECLASPGECIGPPCPVGVYYEDHPGEAPEASGVAELVEE